MALLAENGAPGIVNRNVCEARFLLFSISTFHCARDEKAGVRNRVPKTLRITMSGAPFFAIFAEKGSANIVKRNTFGTRFLLFKMSTFHCARDEKAGVRNRVPETL